MGGRAEKVEVMKVGTEVVMKNCRSASTHRSFIGSSSSTPWTVSTASTTTYLSCGTHTAPYTSCRPPQAASALTYSVHGLDHGWTPDQS